MSKIREDGAEIALIPAGEFEMGSDDGELEAMTPEMGFAITLTKRARLIYLITSILLMLLDHIPLL